MLNHKKYGGQLKTCKVKVRMNEITPSCAGVSLSGRLRKCSKRRRLTRASEAIKQYTRSVRNYYIIAISSNMTALRERMTYKCNDE